MQSELRALFRAIVKNDRGKVRAMLRKNLALANCPLEGGSILEPNIAHWIYTGDAALHVAAAGYRIEIARLLLAAGADATAAGHHRLGQPLHYAADGYLNNPHW